MLSITPYIEIPDQELDFSFSRSAGPGGQNVNKVSSKALLRWQVSNSNALPTYVKQRFLEKYSKRLTTEGEIILTSQKYRDQKSNIDDCLEKLKEMINSVLLPPTPRLPTKPSKAAKERRTAEKRQQSVRKQQRRTPGRDD